MVGVLNHSAKLCLAILIGLSTVVVPGVRPAVAQDASAMDCDSLWKQRNAIYARNGYCFQTDRAISTFGSGCFPPYGRLYGDEARRVQELQYWERTKGC
ncbi:YARHG domain-containing protein [Rhizobiales bacterium GAS113]|nr:YARHG domain-containing protein [Rhizobiales bacterium GAS113]